MNNAAQRAAERIREAMYPPDNDGPIILSVETMAQLIAEETDKDLARLVQIAAEMQRESCVEQMPESWMHSRFAIQNTPCPDGSEVLRKWREALPSPPKEEQL